MPEKEVKNFRLYIYTQNTIVSLRYTIFNYLLEKLIGQELYDP